MATQTGGIDLQSFDLQIIVQPGFSPSGDGISDLIVSPPISIITQTWEEYMTIPTTQSTYQVWG